jgi:uncharacterized protein YbaP (TraB family)
MTNTSSSFAKIAFLGTLLIFCIHLSFAQKSLLFEVQHPKQKHSSFVFGTMHVTNEKVFQFNDRVYQAIDKCENALFELDLNAIDQLSMKPEMLQKFQSKMNENKDLQNDISSYMVQDFLPKIMALYNSEQFSEVIFDKLINVVKAMSDMYGSNGRQDFLDAHLQNYARSKDKNIVGLETFMEQIEAIMGGVSLNNYHQIGDKILEFIAMNNEEFNTLFSGSSQDLMNDYTAFDLDKVCDFLDSTYQNATGSNYQMYQRLFIERNNVQFQKALPYFYEKSTFMAVGAGHLCGDNGVLAQLKNAGFRIRPVDISSNFKIHSEMRTTRMTDYYDSSNIIQFKLPDNAKIFENSSEGQTEKFIIDEISFEVVRPLGKAQLTVSAAFFYEEDMEEEFDDEIVPVWNGATEDTNDEIEMEMDDDYDEGEDDDFIVIPDNTEEALNDENINENNVKNKFTKEQKTYFKEVGNHLQMKLMSNPELLESLNFGVKKETRPENRTLNHKSGIPMEIVTTKIGNTYYSSTTIELSNGIFTLSLGGDLSLLNSGELDTFFTDFEAIEKD